MDGSHNVFLPWGQRGVYFCDKWGLPQNVLLGEPRHLPFCQLFDPIHLLMFPFSSGDDEVWYPGVVINDVSFRAIAGREWDLVSIGVQLSFKVRYLVSKAKATQGVLLLSFSDGGGEALGNVEDSS
jgi:hypothetical protein